MSTWADYSFARPSLSTLKSMGVVGVLRYLAPLSADTSGKVLTAAERDQILSAGLDLCLNFEWTTGRCNQGRAAGLEDGRTALDQAKALGYPRGKTIYFSHDTSAYDWTAIYAYFQAVAEIFAGYYNVGAYGSYDLVRNVRANAGVRYTWQTIAWSNGLRDPQSVIYQNQVNVVGGAADLDEVTSTDIGSWKDGPGIGEEDLTVDEHNHLYQVFTWMQEVINTTRSLAQNDTVLKGQTGDLELRVADLQAKVAALPAATTATTTTAGIDLDLLANKVADKLAARLAS